MKSGFMDDDTLSGELQTAEREVSIFLGASQDTGLGLNQSDCEIIMEDFTAISSSSPLCNFCKVAKEEMTLLGTPVINDTAQDRAITHKKIDEISRDIDRLA